MSAAALGRLLDLMADNTISGRIAKDVFEAMVETGDDPAAIVEAKGLRQVTDTGAIDAAVDSVLAANADKVAEYKAGKEKLFGFFVGQVMKAMAGKGNPGAGQRGAEAEAVVAYTVTKPDDTDDGTLRRVPCRSNSTPGTRRTAARSAWRWRRWGCPTTSIR